MKILENKGVKYDTIQHVFYGLVFKEAEEEQM
jgi:hypothetical protein